MAGNLIDRCLIEPHFKTIEGGRLYVADTSSFRLAWTGYLVDEAKTDELRHALLVFGFVQFLSWAAMCGSIFLGATLLQFVPLGLLSILAIAISYRFLISRRLTGLKKVVIERSIADEEAAVMRGHVPLAIAWLFPSAIFGAWFWYRYGEVPWLVFLLMFLTTGLPLAVAFTPKWIRFQ